MTGENLQSLVYVGIRAPLSSVSDVLSVLASVSLAVPAVEVVVVVLVVVSRMVIRVVSLR